MADTTTTPARTRRNRSGLSAVPYLPGLDGMRAIAVIAVMIYHANSNWLSGGFLGVDVFFVISGYLITLLLMAEWERGEKINVPAFWGRRARRLLPALFLMMFLLLVYTTFFRASTLGKLRGDLIAGLLYVSNWYQIWVGQGYSAVGDFAPLRHLWSLAVEEQFYIVWPLVMMLLLRGGGTRRLARKARWLVLAAVLVTILTALLYHPGRVSECSVTPEAYWHIGERCISKADALYLSTITRSVGLLLGAAFAMVWRPMAIMRGPLRRANRLLDLIAVVGILILAFMMWNLHFLTPEGADPWLFRGGFFVASVATLMVIAAVTHRRTITSKVLGTRVLLYLGTRSYGLYLYHWPIYQIIRKVAGNPLSWPQFSAAMVATLIITELSYTFVETPIRRGEVRGWLRSLRTRRDPVPRQVFAATVVVSALLLAFCVIRLGTADLIQNEIARDLEEGAKDVVSIEELLGDDDGSTEGTEPPVTQATTPEVTDEPTTESTTTTSTTSTTTTTLPKEPVDFLAIGDSVMLGAATVLTDRGYMVNAEVNRQMIDAVPVMEALGNANLFGDPIIIHLGTNGPISSDTLNALLAPLSGVPNVLLLTVRANRSWAAGNNAIIRARDHPNDNIRLIDWEVESANCVGNCFAADGIHLSSDGKQFYANMIGDWTGR